MSWHRLVHIFKRPTCRECYPDRRYSYIRQEDVDKLRKARTRNYDND